MDRHPSRQGARRAVLRRHDRRHLASADVGQQVADRDGGRGLGRQRRARRRRGTHRVRPCPGELRLRRRDGATPARHALGHLVLRGLPGPDGRGAAAEQAIGWAPRTVPDLPATMYDYLLTLRQTSPHGGPFNYRSCETDVLGWICEAAGGLRMPELMSALLWSKLGADRDATIGVDSGRHGDVRRRDQRVPARPRPVRVAFPQRRNVDDRRARGLAVVDRRHIRRRRRLTFSVRRKPGRQPHVRRHVPQPVLVPVSGQQCVAVLGDSRADDLHQPGGRRCRGQAVELAVAQDATKLFPTIAAFDEIAAGVS